MDSDGNKIEGRLKFSTRKPRPVFQGLAKLSTPYALKLLEKEMCRKGVNLILFLRYEILWRNILHINLIFISLNCFQSGCVFRLTSSVGENVTSANLHTCSCSLFMSYGLPCSRIIYLATENKVSFQETAYNSCWNV